MTGFRLLSRRPFFRDRSGVSAVEFALLAPIFLAILAGTADFGTALRAKLNLNSAVSAGANYALLNAGDITSASAAGLAADIGKILAANTDAYTGMITVNVNNAETLSVTDSKTTTTGGGGADACYCPTGSGAAMEWGNAVTCGSACPAGGFAGKFVFLSVSKPFSSLFGGYGMVRDGQITAQAIAQVQ